jgi:LacI family transcriptional regulator
MKANAPGNKGFTSNTIVSTITDVARLAGVSIKTVSRVVNNEPNVKPETRLKVQEAAVRLSYRPNFLARSLAGARSYLIGLFYDNPVPAYVNEIQRGVIRRTREGGYHLMIEPQNSHDPNLERTIATLLATIKLDGVILTPPLSDNEVVLRAIEAANVPFVRISPYLNPERSMVVCIDDVRAAFEMTSHLLDQGHQDIGFIAGHPDHGSSHRRFEGFEQALKARGLSVRREWVKQGYYSFESGFEAAQALLAEPQLPTAVFACNDYMAFGVMASAQRAGIRVPEDMSVAGFDDTPSATMIWPHLTTIRQPVELMAYAAAEMLLARTSLKDTQGNLDQDLGQKLSFALIERDSIKPL